MRSRAVRSAIRCYEMLLWLYPKEFRCKHAGEMACVFGESCRAEWRARGNRGLTMLVLVTLHDLIVSAAAERVSVFITELKWDKRMLAGTPSFRAAAAIVCTICLAVVGMLSSGALNRVSPWQRWIFLAEMCLNIGVLWAASVVLARAGARRSGYATSVFFEKLRAFRHLSGSALRLLAVITGAALIPAAKSAAHGQATGHMPPWWQCAIFPLLLLLLVMVFFLLDPLLSPNSGGGNKRWRRSQLRAG